MRPLNNKEIATIVVTLIAASGLIAYGNGAISLPNTIKEAEVAKPGTRATDEPAVSTSTTIALRSRNYNRGDCITWNQDAGGGSLRRTIVVPCAEPHLLEYVGRERLRKVPASYPTDDEMHELIDEHCTGPVEEFLGYAIDPSGRFYVSALSPTAESWATGDRDLICGIAGHAAEPEVQGDDTDVWTGEARGADQTLIYPIGTCFTETSSGVHAVSCAEKWGYRVVGNVDLSKHTVFPPEDQWRTLADSECKRFATASIPELSILPIPPTSWAAGQRIAQCVSLSA